MTRPPSRPACSTRRSPDQLRGVLPHRAGPQRPERYDTAAEMLAAWRSVFEPVPRDRPRRRRRTRRHGGAVDPAGPWRACPPAPCRRWSLTGVVTVGDLVAVDPVRLNRLSGVADATRREVKARARQWRDRFGAAVTGRGHEPMTAGAAGLAGPARSGRRRRNCSLAHAGTARAAVAPRRGPSAAGPRPRPRPVREPGRDGGALGVTRARVAQQMGALQDGWAAHAACRELLDTRRGHRPASPGRPGRRRHGRRTGRGGPRRPAPRRPGDPVPAARIAAGLLRLALDRAAGPESGRRERSSSSSRAAAAAESPCWPTDPALLDPAEALGRTADDLVAAGRGRRESRWCPAARAARGCRRPGAAPSPSRKVPPWRSATGRLLRLAAALARDAALAGSDDLYRRDLPVDRRSRHRAEGVGGTPVRHRAGDPRPRPRQVPRPGAAARPSPARPARGRGRARAWSTTKRSAPTARPPARRTPRAWPPRLATSTPSPASSYRPADASGHRLTESATTRSFLALGVDAARTDRAIDALTGQFGVKRRST